MTSSDPNLSICRVCLCENGVLKSIFTVEDFSESMLQVNEVMTACASVQVEIDDGLPQEICEECFGRLSEAYAFRNLCEQTDFTLRNNLVLIIKSDEENLEQVNIIEEMEDIVRKEEVADSPETIKNIDCSVDEFEHDDISSNDNSNTIQISDESNEEENENLEHVNIAEASGIDENIVNESQEVIETKQQDGLIAAGGNSSSYENKNFKVIKIYDKHRGIFKCKVCSKQLTSKSGLSRHNKLHLNIKPYKCEVCNQCYAIKHELLNHQTTHSKVKPYSCDLCEIGFNNKGALSKHNRNTHGPVKLRECHICKRFFSEEALEGHLTTHTEADRKHQCDHCGKCFFNTSKLKRHIKTHVGIACFICRKYFPDKASLEMHRDTHTDADKKHQCTNCDLRFYTRSKLMRHLGTHTGQRKPHGCVICDKHFRDGYNLRQHMKIHTGEKDFKCDVCGKLFPVRTALTRHKKQHDANQLKKVKTKNSKQS